MNLQHFLSKMPLKPPWPLQLPESSPESSQRASESLPDASESKKNTVWVLALGLLMSKRKAIPGTEQNKG